METAKSIATALLNIFGISITALNFFIFGLVDVKNIIIYILTIIFLAYKAYDSHLNAKLKELDVKDRKRELRKKELEDNTTSHTINVNQPNQPT
jgi:Tfp pilus assembly protein PilO